MKCDCMGNILAFLLTLNVSPAETREQNFQLTCYDDLISAERCAYMYVCTRVTYFEQRAQRHISLHYVTIKPCDDNH